MQRTAAAYPGVLGPVTPRSPVRAFAVRVALVTVVFAALDFVWLAVFMNGFYKTQLGDMARLSGGNFAPIWWAAWCVYAALILGIVVFVLPRAAGRPARGFGFGAAFGLVAYGTYDLTAYAVLAGWPLAMTLVDMVWGALICGLSAATAVLIEPRLGRADDTLSGARLPTA